MTYTPVTIPIWKLRPEFEASGLPRTVSFFGATPHPAGAYTQARVPSVEIDDRGRITYSNTFFGRRLETFQDAVAASEKLNNL